jgi:hypothetical protein
LIIPEKSSSILKLISIVLISFASSSISCVYLAIPLDSTQEESFNSKPSGI